MRARSFVAPPLSPHIECVRDSLETDPRLRLILREEDTARGGARDVFRVTRRPCPGSSLARRCQARLGRPPSTHRNRVVCSGAICRCDAGPGLHAQQPRGDAPSCRHPDGERGGSSHSFGGADARRARVLGWDAVLRLALRARPIHVEITAGPADTPLRAPAGEPAALRGDVACVSPARPRLRRASLFTYSAAHDSFAQR